MAGKNLISIRSKPSSKPPLEPHLPALLTKLTAHQAARRLLGSELARTVDGQLLIGRIVETESYEETDRAAHSYGGPRGRNRIMFGPAAHAYVYFTYGMHYCVNVVVGPVGQGAAVLIRAIEPLAGVTTMQQNRRLPEPSVQISNGPAKLTQALQIGAELNGHSLNQPPLQLLLRPALLETAITTTTRIGIRHNSQFLQRFYITDSPWVSKR